MTDQRFDEQLVTFLRWQAAQTGGAPSALEVASRMPVSTRRARPAGRGLALSLTLVIVGLLIAAVGLALVGAYIRPTPMPLGITNGPLVSQGPACGLVGKDPISGATSVIAEDVAGCPKAHLDGAFFGLTYDDVVGSPDGTIVAYARRVFCGGCVSTPTAEALAAQGVYVADLATGTTTRLDQCTAERCSFHVAISPDGRYVGFSEVAYATLDKNPRTDTVTTVDRESGRSTSLPTPETLANEDYTALVWDPDTRSFSAAIMAGSWSPDGSRSASFANGILSVWDVTGGTTKFAIRGWADASLGSADVALVGQPVWSPDGRSILVNLSSFPPDEREHIETYQVPLDGGEATPFTGDWDPPVIAWLPARR